MPQTHRRQQLYRLAEYYKINGSTGHAYIVCAEAGYFLFIAGYEAFGSSFEPGDAFYSAIDHPEKDIREHHEYTQCVANFRVFCDKFGDVVSHTDYWAICIQQKKLAIPLPNFSSTQTIIDLTHSDEDECDNKTINLTQSDEDECGTINLECDTIDLTHKAQNMLVCIICLENNCDYTMACCKHKKDVHIRCLNQWFRVSKGFICPACKGDTGLEDYTKYKVDYSGMD